MGGGGTKMERIAEARMQSYEDNARPDGLPAIGAFYCEPRQLLPGRQGLPGAGNKSA